MFSSIALLAFALVRVASAQVDTLRATIPGSLHQCEMTNMFFFDSSNTRPLTVVLLPSSEVPDSIRSGTILYSTMAQYNPLQVISGITAPDATQFDFTLQVAAEQEFEVFGFFANGQGKALSLTRTVTTALPGATSCNPRSAGNRGAAAVTTAAPAATATSASSSGGPVTVTVTVYPTASASASSPASASASASSSGSSSMPTGTMAVTQCVQQCAQQCAQAFFAQPSATPSANARVRRRHF